jgi:putative flippase GtrA
MPGSLVERDIVRKLFGTAGAGGTGWLIDAAVLWLLGDHLHLPLAFASGTAFVTGAIATFLLNRLVFKATRGRRGLGQSSRYLLLFAVNFVLVSTMVPLISRHLPASLPSQLLVAKVIVTAALLPCNTLAYDRWVFRQRPSPGSRP